MFTENALDLIYAHAGKSCDAGALALFADELLAAAGRKSHTWRAPKDPPRSGPELQRRLARLNEKAARQKSKGVYYTPEDLVRFILTGSVKAACGKLAPQSIGGEGLESVPWRVLALQKTVFDPTCGAGEFPLAALEIKLGLLERRGGPVTPRLVRAAAATVFGNDIDRESVIIARLRLLLCVLERYGAAHCAGLAAVLRRNFSVRDYLAPPPAAARPMQYDIIVGNPPYVEVPGGGAQKNRGYGNLYAEVLVRAAEQLAPRGSLGFVIPLSYIATPRMASLRDTLTGLVPEQYILSYSDRPDCLFDSVHQKLCVLIGKRRAGPRRIYTGSYQYWYREERAGLFAGTRVVRNRFYTPAGIPKLGSGLDLAIYKKITDPRTMTPVYDVSRTGEEAVYLNRRETFWMKAYRERIDDPEYKVFRFSAPEEADYCYCLINSSLFWWYWICTSDCWHVSRELNGFMAPFPGEYKKAVRLAAALQKRLEETKVYVGTRQTEYEYKHRACIREIRAIDSYVNGLFGLTRQESSYIKNFAFQYRTSGGAGKG